MSEAISNAIDQQLERQHRSCQRPVRHTMGRSRESRRTDDDDARVGAYTTWTCIFGEINPVEVKTCGRRKNLRTEFRNQFYGNRWNWNLDR
jgi:hypothetical protein